MKNRAKINELIGDCRADVFSVGNSLENDEALQAEFETLNDVFERLDKIAALIDGGG
jgi:hypothetical protein